MPAAVITGASSGIGEALARELAGRGWDLALTARRLDRLHAIKADIEQQHPHVSVLVESLDVCRSDDVASTIAALMDSVDDPVWVVANAGVGSTEGSPIEQAATMIDTNLTGAVATIETAIAWFETNQRLTSISGASHAGHLVRSVIGVSSVAGFRGLPHSPVYSATKAGLSTYLEGRRASLANAGVRVVDIAPGFIETPMAGSGRPAQISAAKAAKIIVDRIEAGAFQAVVPALPWRAIKPVMRLLPGRALNVILSRTRRE